MRRAPALPWIRMDAAVFHYPAIRALRPWGAFAWLGILSMAKMHGWSGVCPVEGVTGESLAEHLGLPRDHAGRLEKAVAGLVDAGLLRRRPKHLVVPDWRRYQIDPGGTERSRRSRGLHKPSDYTTSDAGATVATMDGTGLDGTGRTSTSTPPSPSPPLPEPGPAEATAPGGDPPPTLLTPGHLTPAMAQVLSLSGVGPAHLRDRPGDWWKWEKNIQAISDSGTADDAIVRALKDPKCKGLMPHQFLEMFQPKDPRGRVLLPVPGRSSTPMPEAEKERIRREVDAMRRGIGGPA